MKSKSGKYMNRNDKKNMKNFIGILNQLCGKPEDKTQQAKMDSELSNLGPKRLSLDSFQLNCDENKKKQEMFHYALGNLIDTYNNYGEEECKKNNIYYIESRIENNSLLANISVNIMEDYYKYKDLFLGLLSGQTKFFSEYKINIKIKIMCIKIKEKEV